MDDYKGMGSANSKNADALLAAGMISEKKYKEMKSGKKKGKKKSLIEKWKELVK